MALLKYSLSILIITIVCFPPWSISKFSTNTFHIASGSEKLTVSEDHIKDEAKDYFSITNFGMQSVEAVVQTKGSVFGSFYDEASETVRPRQHLKIRIPSNGKQKRPWQLMIRNNGERAALVYAGVNGNYWDRERTGLTWYNNINPIALLKSVTTFSAGYIPVVGGAISAIIDFFWPITTPDVWSQISDKVKNVVDDKVLALVKQFLSGKLRRFKKRIWAIGLEFDMGPEDENDTHLANHYLNLAQDMFGLEEEFLFDRHSEEDKKMNYYLLPYFVKLVTLQMQVYDFGILHQKKIGLDKSAIRSLELFKNSILYMPHDGAVAYVRDSYKEHAMNAYEQCEDGEEIYNCVANARSYLTVNGLDYAARWTQSIGAQARGDKPLSCNPVFSEYLGRPSHDLNEIGAARYEPEELLTEFWSGDCSKMVKVIVYSCQGNLCGMQTFFNDYNEYTMGEESRDKTLIEFKGRSLKKINVYGSATIEGLEFVFDDEKMLAGKASRTSLTGTFALDEYRIAGILVTNGLKISNPKALVNIAVSYLPEIK